MHYQQSHGFDTQVLESQARGEATVPANGPRALTHFAVLREHGRYFFARSGIRGKISMTWRIDPNDATWLTRVAAEEIASRFPGRVVALEGDVCLAFYRKEQTDGN